MFFLVYFYIIIFYLLENLSDYIARLSLDLTIRSLNYVVAEHRNTCLSLPSGCKIDAVSICKSVAFFPVKCSYKGGVDAKSELVFYSGAKSSMGSFYLTSLGRAIICSVSYFSSVRCSY